MFATITKGPKGHFGEMALVTDERRSNDVIALEACELGVLRKSDLFAVLNDYPELLRSIMTHMNTIGQGDRRKSAIAAGSKPTLSNDIKKVLAATGAANVWMKKAKVKTGKTAASNPDAESTLATQSPPNSDGAASPAAMADHFAQQTRSQLMAAAASAASAAESSPVMSGTQALKRASIALERPGAGRTRATAGFDALVDETRRLVAARDPSSQTSLQAGFVQLRKVLRQIEDAYLDGDSEIADTSLDGETCLGRRGWRGGAQKTSGRELNFARNPTDLMKEVSEKV